MYHAESVTLLRRNKTRLGLVFDTCFQAIPATRVNERPGRTYRFEVGATSLQKQVYKMQQRQPL